MKRSLIVNLIGGPGCGKSVMAAQLFVDLKKNTKHKIEYFQEYVKPLVWKVLDPNHKERAEDAMEQLNNQRLISSKIYQLLKIMSEQLDIIITDGSIFHGLHYNRSNKHNTSDQDKTEKFLESIFLPKLKKFAQAKTFKDPKSIFQELSQAQKGVTPRYKVLKEEGPDHKKEFVVVACIGQEEIATGKGTNKQKAEEKAAQKAIKALQ